METLQSFPLVYVIIITFNGKHHLASCLPSVFATDYPNYKVLLVDNASIDGSTEFVRSNFPEVEVLRNEKNYGFAKGNNLAIIAALNHGADYVFLLNDDTKILDPCWLMEAVKVAENDQKIGMIGFQLTDSASMHITKELTCTRDVNAIEGCALFISSALLRNVGLFDEVYFAYAEESDLEMRAMRAGYRMIELNIPIFHLGAGTSNRYPIKRSYLIMRNVIRHSIKNRNALKTLMRIIKTFDISSNPRPFFFDRKDVTHQKIRGQSNVLLNFVLFFGAVLWNVIHLPQTLLIRYKENK